MCSANRTKKRTGLSSILSFSFVFLVMEGGYTRPESEPMLPSMSLQPGVLVVGELMFTGIIQRSSKKIFHSSSIRGLWSEIIQHCPLSFPEVHFSLY